MISSLIKILVYNGYQLFNFLTSESLSASWISAICLTIGFKLLESPNIILIIFRWIVSVIFDLFFPILKDLILLCLHIIINIFKKLPSYGLYFYRFFGMIQAFCIKIKKAKRKIELEEQENIIGTNGKILN